MRDCICPYWRYHVVEFAMERFFKVVIDWSGRYSQNKRRMENFQTQINGGPNCLGAGKCTSKRPKVGLIKAKNQDI